MNAAFAKLGALVRPTIRRTLVGAAVVGAFAVVAAMPAPGAAATPAPQGIMDLNGPKRAAQRAVAAENAQLSAQTGQSVPTNASAAAPISGPGSHGVPATPALTTAGAIESGSGSRLGAPV